MMRGMGHRPIESNGGFPEPPAGLAVRVLSARHDVCGERTRLRVPAVLPARAVRRVVCHGCAQTFATEGLSEPRPWLDPGSRTWRYVSVPVAAGAVVGGLLLIQGQDDGGIPTLSPAAQGHGAAAVHQPARHANAAPQPGARLIRGSTFSLALPGGWRRTAPEAGATFAATAPAAAADVSLWIDRDAGLDFPTFEARSLEQLRQLAGSAHIVDRIAAPTPDATVVRLAADAPAGSARYEVVLRASGPFRYYLATTLQPDAPPAVAEDIRLIQGSLTPEANG